MGKICRQDFLGFAAEGSSFFRIHFHSNLIGERVETRIAVVSAVGAVGWEALGGKSKLKKIGIGVGADPALVGDLKIPSGNVGEERREFERAKFELDANAAPLFLKSRSHKARLLIG